MAERFGHFSTFDCRQKESAHISTEVNNGTLPYGLTPSEVEHFQT